MERLVFPETGRVRDVREAPDGTLWFLSEERGAVYRIRPVSVGGWWGFQYFVGSGMVDVSHL